MRKWMRDRLKRRKKNTEETAAQPAPLQPAYFEAEPQAAEPQQVEAEPVVETDPSDGAPEPSETEPSGVETTRGSRQAGQSTSQPRRPRRRRGRGGRGRRGSAPQTPAPMPTPTDQAPTAVSPAPPVQRATKGIVVLAVGLPGSGKSSWFKRHNITPLSSDMLRTILFDDPAEQRFQDLVFSNLRSMLKARLIARRPMNYVDATNLTPQERQNWIKLAKDFGYEVHAVFFDVPLEVCIERHHRRDRLVPEDIMRKMAGKLKPPTFDEGFSKITVVRVKQKAAG